jgi:hypothetical protein
MKTEFKDTDKVGVSSRIPMYVKKYASKRGITISQLIMKGFDAFRESDKEHALNRLDYHEKRVLHWKHIVLQDEEACNTKHHICNTIKKQFVKAGRGNVETKKQDMSWLQAKAEQMVNEGIIVTAHELYSFCMRKEK